jgi:plasmid maintenance system antidote protein VapI
MIRLSQLMKEYLRAFESIEKAAEFLGVHVNTIYALLDGRREPSQEFIEKVKLKVGWDFEKAFEIVPDADVGEKH